MIQIGKNPATVDSPIEHLMACHRRIEQRLDTLVRAAGYLDRDRPSALAAIAKSLTFFDTSGVLHTEDEEQSVFPRLRSTRTADQIAYLDSLEQDHGKAEAILQRLKQLAVQAERQTEVPGTLIERYRACARELQALYVAHIQSEDEVLTVMAKEALSESDLSEISREMRQRRAPRL